MMISAISAYTPYSTYTYGTYAGRAAQAPDKAQAAQRPGMVMTAHKAAQPETPVQPVTPVRAVNGQEDPAQTGLLRQGSDPAEMAVRMRIQYPGDPARNAAGAEKAQAPVLPGARGDGAQQVRNPLDKGSDAQKAANPALDEAKSAQEVMEEGECQTCKERKYQDGSDDPGVSFKTPTNISPDRAAFAVRGHENEHVVREQAKARQNDRKVVSQSVTYHTAICPECGKVYVSGGTTRTVTRANTDRQAQQQNQEQQNPRAPFSAVA